MDLTHSYLQTLDQSTNSKKAKKKKNEKRHQNLSWGDSTTGEDPRPLGHLNPRSIDHSQKRQKNKKKIGKKSCREREKIWVAALSLKKKLKTIINNEKKKKKKKKKRERKTTHG